MDYNGPKHPKSLLHVKAIMYSENRETNYKVYWLKCKGSSTYFEVAFKYINTQCLIYVTKGNI